MTAPSLAGSPTPRVRYGVLLVLATLGCEAETAVLVRLEVDEALAPDVATLGLEVYSGGGKVFEREEAFAGSAETISIRPGTLAEDATIYLHGFARTEDDRQASRWQEVVFVPGKDLDACLLLEAPCLGVACGTDDCRAGGCEPVVAAKPACAPTSCSPTSSCDDHDDATEDSCGRDDMCRHADPNDRDDDGHASLAAGGDDCDDFDARTYAGAPEACDGVDRDCDGIVDGTILARTQEPEAVALPRVLATESGWLLAWTLGGDPSPLDQIAYVAPGDDAIVVTDELPGALPALLRTDDLAFLAHLGAAGGIDLVALAADGTVAGEPVRLVEGLGCSDTYLPRLVGTAFAGFLAVAYHACPEDSTTPVAHLAGLDTSNPGAAPLVARLGGAEPSWFPSATILDGNAIAAWTEGGTMHAATVGLEGAVTPVEVGLSGALPALLPVGDALALVFLDAQGGLHAVTFSSLEPTDVLVDVDPLLAFVSTFPGTDSGGDGAATAYFDLRPGESAAHELLPYVVQGRDPGWTSARVTPLTGDTSIGSSGADVTASADGERYFVDTPGEVGAEVGTVVFGRLSCPAR